MSSDTLGKERNGEWETSDGTREGVVCGTEGAKLYLVANGPPRRPGQPVVIFEAGLGVSSVCWTAVQRLLDKRIRSYRYDRAGYGHSPASAAARTATNMAAELLDVLRTAGVSAPYIIVAHSYGGIIAREFMAAAGPDAISGMVLVDANQENTHPQLRVPFAAIEGLCGGRNYLDVIGFKRDNRYTPEELGRLSLDESVSTARSTEASEGALILDSSTALGAKLQLETQPLGLRPVTVIRGDAGRDFRCLLAAAQDGKYGTRENVAEMNEFLTHRFDAFDCDLQKQQLRLSGNSRFVQAANSGHAVMGTEPELVAEEILGIWQNSI
ncbi:Alpha/Beta hydrolase protein [Cadophora sp. MPI-SDFR-AT-0126]|nr:Alpha/Beta hydrolase protein [Leotiomycetes sp. MPI-SDFR-AT-0126]